MMNQDVHLWIAIVLVQITVIIIHVKNGTFELGDDLSLMSFFMFLVGMSIVFSVWLYRIS